MADVKLPFRRFDRHRVGRHRTLHGIEQRDGTRPFSALRPRDFSLLTLETFHLKLELLEALSVELQRFLLEFELLGALFGGHGDHEEDQSMHIDSFV